MYIISDFNHISIESTIKKKKNCEKLYVNNGVNFDYITDEFK